MRKIFALTVFLSLFLFGCGERSVTSSISLGGEWFLNNQDESFLHYQYDLAEREYGATHHSAREFGALWSITQLADFLEDDRYTELALKGWEYFSSTFVEAPEGYLYVNITPSKVKLSYNAFAILTLLELDVPNREALLEQLANGLLVQQKSSGELDTFYFSDRATGVDYYPGQALLALMSLYEETGNEIYLEAVAKAFPFYQNYFNESPNTAFVPWQTQAYFKYYQVSPSEEIADFIFTMNDTIVNNFSEDSCQSFDFSGIVTAVYIEGLNKAYALAEQVNDAERSECYRRFITEGSAYVIDLQFPMKDQNPDEYPPVAMGGFFGSSYDLSFQVDRNQHAVMALMGAYELGLIK